MKIISNNNRICEVILDLSLIDINDVFINDEDILLGYNLSDIPTSLENTIFDLAEKCGMFFVDLNRTKFKLYITAPEDNKLDVSLLIELAPIQIGKDKVNDLLISFEDYQLSALLKESSFDDGNFEVLELSLNEKENKKLSSLLITKQFLK